MVQSTMRLHKFEFKIFEYFYKCWSCKSKKSFFKNPETLSKLYILRLYTRIGPKCSLILCDILYSILDDTNLELNLQATLKELKQGFFGPNSQVFEFTPIVVINIEKKGKKRKKKHCWQQKSGNLNP